MLALDHIVISGKDLSKESERDKETFQITAIKGGEHENWGTYNYVAYFSNHSYIEWLGVDKPEIARQSDNPLIRHLVHVLDAGHQEPFQFALRTSQLDSYVAHFKSGQIPFIGPIQGKRKKPDGKILTWRMLFPIYDFTKETLPFLIEWDQPEAERIDANVVNKRAISTIHFGGTTIERFAHIYRMAQEEENKITLANSEIIFTDKTSKLQFKIV